MKGDNDTSRAMLLEDELASDFAYEGYLCISNVFTSEEIHQMYILAMQHFHQTLQIFIDNEHEWHSEPTVRLGWTRGQIAVHNGTVGNVKEEGEKTNNCYLMNKGCCNNKANYVTHKNNDNVAGGLVNQIKWEHYPKLLQPGVRNGYREIVMRNPGRYELGLYNNNDQENDNNGRGCRLMRDVRDKMTRDHCSNSGTGWNVSQDGGVKANNDDACNNYHCFTSTVGVLPSTKPTAKSPETLEALRDAIDTIFKKKHQLRKLIRSCLLPSKSSTYESVRKKNLVHSFVCCNSNFSEQEPEIKKDDESKGFIICNVSIVIATPGAEEQKWHADGGHLNLTTHEACHCLNVFIPLLDITAELGPTELRPGTHFHTRNLAPMMLAAMARKSLRPPVAPLLNSGDVLMFDYRILHRGRANNSMTTSRPVLVITLAKPWFKDKLNFPKRSMYDGIDDTQHHVS